MSYESTVLTDTPLGFWRLGDASGTTAADTSGNSLPGTYSGTKTLAVAGPLDSDADTAVQFAGAGAFQRALNLSAHNKITVEFWLKWPSTPATDQMIVEFTANGATTAGGFSFSNIGGANHVWRAAMGTTLAAEFGAGSDTYHVAAPTMNKWHHIVLEFDRTAALAIQSGIRLWVDAVERFSTVRVGSTAVGGTFVSSTLYAMARTASSLFATGTLDELAIYSGLLSTARIDAHYLAGTNLDWIHSGSRAITTMFPSSNIWHDELPDDAPLHANSRLWTDNLINQMGLDAAQRDSSQYVVPLRASPGYVLGSLSYYAGSGPIYVVPDNQPLVPVAVYEVVEPILAGASSFPRLDRFHEQIMAGVPIPDHVEPDLSGDRYVTIWQPGTNKYWEFWLTYHISGVEGPSVAGGLERPYEWVCLGGGHMRDTSLSNGTYKSRTALGVQYEDYQDGATGTSIPLGGMPITVEEWNADLIEHALDMVVYNASGQTSFPAARNDGTEGAGYIPEGSLVRLDPDLDIDAGYPGTDYLSRKIKMLAHAAQDYGIYLTDKTLQGCAFRVRNVTSYRSEGLTTYSPVMEYNVPTGTFRDDAIFQYFPWATAQVVDPDWVQARWPATPVPPVAIENLTDSFSTLDTVKWASRNGTTTASGNQMHLVIGSTVALLDTDPTYYSLTGSSIFFEAVQMPSNVLASEGILRLVSSVDTANCFVEWAFSDGLMIADYMDGTVLHTRHRVAQPTYDSVAHRWLRIREAAGTVYWDASSDGFTWTTLGSVVWTSTSWTADALTSMKVQLFAENYNAVVGAQDFIIDNLNVAPTGPPSDPDPESKYVKLQAMIMDPANDTYEISYVDADALFEDLTPRDPLP